MNKGTREWVVSGIFMMCVLGVMLAAHYMFGIL